MNCLDHRSNLISNREASPVMGPFSQGHWRSIGNHITLRLKNQKGFIFIDMEELRQVYSLQFIQVTECKVSLNCKFLIATAKGRGTQACMKYE